MTGGAHVEPCDSTDLVDVPADGRHFDGFTQMWPADDLEDVVGAVIPGQAQDALAPAVLTAINEMIGAERHYEVTLGCASGHDHLRAVHLGDLNTEQ